MMWKRVSGLMGRLYRLCWQATFRRPWTYVMREHPWFPLTLFGVALAAQVIWQHLWVILPADGVMVLTGHVLWDTAGSYLKYRRDFIPESFTQTDGNGAMYFKVRNGTVSRTIEAGNTGHVDLDVDGNVIGFEDYGA